MHLFEIPVGEAQTRSIVRVRLSLFPGAWGYLAKGPGDAVDDIAMIQVAGSADQNVLPNEAAFEMSKKIISAHVFNGFPRAQNRTPERMITPKGLTEEIVHQIVGGILHHTDFLEDNATFLFNLIEVKYGGLERIGKKVDGQGEMPGQNLSVKTTVFPAGEGVKHSTNRVNLPGNFKSTAAAGSFEEQMLDKVRNATLRLMFVT